MKKCDKIRELLPLYLSDDLDSPDRQRVSEHLRGCDVCSRQLEVDRELQLALEPYRHIEIPQDVELNFMANLYKQIAIEAMRPQASDSESNKASSLIMRYLSLKPPLWASSFAAAFALIVGLFIGSWYTVNDLSRISQANKMASLQTEPPAAQSDSHSFQSVEPFRGQKDVNLNPELGGGRISFIGVPQDENALEQLRNANFLHYSLRDYRRAMSEYKNLSDIYAGSQVAEEAQKQIKKLQESSDLASL